MDYKYLCEIKNDFIDYLSTLITPNIYFCISGASKRSIELYNELQTRAKDKLTQFPEILDIFKMILSDVPHLNEAEIEKAYKDIKISSNCEYFDDLIRACFKSYVIFLTYNPSTENSKFSDPHYYKDFSIKNFIHKCYIESAKYFYENPEIFFKKDRKSKNYEIIRKCIELAIKETIPYNEIIKEYNEINQMKEQKLYYKNNMENIGIAVNNFMAKGQYGYRPNIKNIIEKSSSIHDFERPHDLSNQYEIENFINIENKASNNIKNNFIEKDDLSQLKGGNFILNTTTEITDKNNNVSNNTSVLFDRNKKKEMEVNKIMNKQTLNKINESNSKASSKTSSKASSKTSSNTNSELNSESEKKSNLKSDSEAKSTIKSSKVPLENNMSNTSYEHIIDQKNNNKKIEFIKNNINNKSEIFNKQSDFFNSLVSTVLK
jgi:hypothetical protein